ncbi:chemoreceptor glutamine deamidase CheD [Caenimonas sedimenti]|uniref:Probable chemoreceptor glutamine deamidase CheD n=1 Tax=Caenimonas sedimenti TaxID=2596921 RepID=A0A562ZPW8_9BURK|nr:chemoreceptor glutamine deamidase CheD [Caenimonas sedimenti]TWO70619.1 chemoreceptor glutamine deamidase CheD [Caenimonas sedimenti]
MEISAPVRYFDRDFQVEAVKILPGQYYATEGEGSICTLLGSCVSTCLWDPVLRIGGMNHFMLPGEPTHSVSPWGVSARFGIYAMEVLINEMIHLGADRRRLVAKVFGGARVLQGFESLDVGAKNSEFVLGFLQEEGIQLAAQDLLGVSPRKVHFFPATGKVQVKKLHLQSDDAVQRQERDYARQLARESGGGDIEIFSVPR